MINIGSIPKSTDPRRIDLDGHVLVAHQAEFMPWLGFISKAAMGDIYLILDDTQFKKKNFQNRNKIRFPNKEGWLWLNVPIKNKDSLPNMMDAEFAGKDWKEKHLESIKTSYSKAPYFDMIYPELIEIYRNRQLCKLVDFNIEIIRYAFRKFNISQPVFRVSELKQSGVSITGLKSDLVVSLVKAVEANVLVAGRDGRNYLNYDEFKKNNINLVFQEFNHPTYRQIHGDFIPYMSFIDLLFNHTAQDAITLLGKPKYSLI